MIDMGQYRQGDIDGVPFHTASSQRRSDHRVDEKAFPFGSESQVTDMGLKNPQFEMKIFVLGEDALKRRRELEEVFDRIGPRRLTHPTRGQLTVQILSVRDDEDFTELNVADFVVTFVLAGPQRGLTASVDTQAAVITASLAAEEAVLEAYELPLEDGETVPQDELVESFNRISKTFQQGSGLLRGDFTQSLSSVDVSVIRSADQMVGSATEFVQTAFTTVRRITSYTQNPQSILRALTAYLVPNTQSLWSSFKDDEQSFSSLILLPRRDPVSGQFHGGTVTNSTKELDETFAQIFFDATTIETAKIIAEVDFENLNQAMAFRDAISGAVAESVYFNASSDPQKQSARQSALRNLRTAVFRDINERRTQLPTLEVYTTRASETARVLAYRLNGTLDHTAKIGKRNGVKHPSFVPSETPLLYQKGVSR
ncbi:DNA circularization N-terminal domain-containing protein [Terasakiella sp. A23]|uniref:DNA circularization N-terminal domain-containing protein n=1 Tax=Terasakiella sp. FCG-A23 TaxID=3080561 RepID=UPI00295303BF|nr:DNA circularization N-terminal domain-containing protein [Terasakiella sp. A23]MDV7340968.1 DNA circularization N-terminal domain-containing protein [Terasakiella sp. A23]